MRFKPGVILTYFFQFLIFLIVLSSILTGFYEFAIGGIFALFLSFAPMIAKRRINITLPWGLTFLIALSLYIHLAGEYFGYYLMFSPYYDKTAHFISGATIGLLGFTLVLILDRYTEINLNRHLIVLMIVMFTLGFGAIWEILEFSMDTFFGGNMQHGNADTMLDMIFVLFASIVVAFIGNFYLRKFPKEEVAQIFAGNLNIKYP
ncbi:hypothetical protein F1737_10255 [Methanoplanus sp. FWC-SCC4]|uniref:DUF2238 domain-containing protein n=1 Tax=Methanochimaera problematica TaxID=2609417 RepID=A0AA97FDG4_9EURY|nr:hypothetical protein [Methanoplanus sp. FWC-SCC4]WOF17032.1 hypothetical protein F1737_10255 [Methanoplanus sp. FWC-SCC4]